MARRVALIGISLLLSVSASAVSGCAGAGNGPTGTPRDQSGAPALASGADESAFKTRAERMAQAWREAGGQEQWRKGFVPLQALTVPPEGVALTDGIKQALGAGWYRLATGMPRERGGQTGTVRYPDGGTASVPLVTRAEAYDALDQGDPPPCAGPTVPPAADAPGADGLGANSPASAQPPKACAALTVTNITLGRVELLTSRGTAQVPAWLFTVRELGAAVARVAVAPSAIAPVPTLKTGELPAVPGLLAAQDLTTVKGASLGFRLGVGACDENIRPLLFEADDVVVVAGTANRADKVCTEQLILHPVSVTLAEAAGGRPVLDAVTGQVLTIPTIAPR